MKHTKVIINNVTVKDTETSDPKKVLSWEYEKNQDIINDAEIVASKDIIDLVDLNNGQTVEIWGGTAHSTDERFFYGTIDEIIPEGATYKIKCANEMIQLVRKNVNKIYDSSIDVSAGEVSEIVEDLIETYGGLNAIVQPSGTSDGKRVDIFRCVNTDIYERVVALKKALNWDLYYDDNSRVVKFEPFGYVDSGKTLNVKSEILGLPEWDIDTTYLINDLRVDGATIDTDLTESGQIGVTSGYETTGITLTKTPNSAELLIDSSDPPTTQREGGSKDASSSGYFYIDRENKKIVPATGTTFTTNDYAKVNYIWSSPAPIHLNDDISIGQYGTYQKTISLTDVDSVADAESRAAEILAERSQPKISALCKVKLTDAPRRGESVKIVDTVSPTVNGTALSGTYVVKSIKYRFPSAYEEIEVGDTIKKLSDWQQTTEERLKRIEEKFAVNEDILRELKNFNNKDSTNNAPQIVPRYQKIQTRDTSSDSIWGRDSWNTAYWDNSYAESLVDNFIQQYLNTYTEDFIDTDFKDSSSTATWTGNGSITL